MHHNNLGRFHLHRYLVHGKIVDWVETCWAGSLNGVVLKNFYRGKIASVIWHGKYPSLILHEVKRFYVSSRVWRVARAIPKKKFDFCHLSKLGIDFNFELAAEKQLRFNILCNVTGLVVPEKNVTKDHSFTAAADSEVWNRQVKTLFFR